MTWSSVPLHAAGHHHHERTGKAKEWCKCRAHDGRIFIGHDVCERRVGGSGQAWGSLGGGQWRGHWREYEGDLQALVKMSKSTAMQVARWSVLESYLLNLKDY